MARFEQQHIGGGDERERRGDDQVAGADAGGAHAQVQPGGARIDPDGVAAAGILRHGGFEAPGFRSPMLRLGVRSTAATASRSASVRSGEDMGYFGILAKQILLDEDYSGQIIPARTMPFSGTSALTTALLPMRAPAPMRDAQVERGAHPDQRARADLHFAGQDGAG